MPLISQPPRGAAALLERCQSYCAGFTGRSLKALLWSKFATYDMAALRAGSIMGEAEAQRMLAMRDLTDPAAGPHAMQQLLQLVVAAVQRDYGATTNLYRAPVIIGERENYLRLGFDQSALARDARYAYRVDNDYMLRSHLSGTGPDMLAALAAGGQQVDTVYVMPGIAYRRDTVDRYHAAALHQADFWHVRHGKKFTRRDMRAYVAAIIEAACPGRVWRWNPTSHPYTRAGRQVDVWFDDHWVEVGECGILADDFLTREGLDADRWSGMLFGIGLDRCLMIHKMMPDIRLLRATSSNIADQLLDLQPWQPVQTSSTIRVFDVQVAADEDSDTLGDRSRQVLGDLASYLETVEILDRLPSNDYTLPGGVADVILRLRVTFSSLQGDLPHELVDRATRLLHQGLSSQLVYESANVLQPSGG